MHVPTTAEERMNGASEQFAGALTQSFRTISGRGWGGPGVRLAPDGGLLQRGGQQPSCSGRANRQLTQQLADQQMVTHPHTGIARRLYGYRELYILILAGDIRQAQSSANEAAQSGAGETTEGGGEGRSHAAS